VNIRSQDDESRRALLLSRVRQNRAAVLLCALLLFLFVMPVFSLLKVQLNSTLIKGIVTLLYTTLFLAIVYSIGMKRRFAILFLSVIGLAVLLRVLYMQLEGAGAGQGVLNIIHGAEYSVKILFFLYAITAILRNMFREDHISPEMIFASLCVYLLLGLLWAEAYSLLNLVEGGSFSYSFGGGDQANFMGNTGEQTAVPLYYSFITMTTLGYGDIYPITPSGRMLSSLQAVVGQLYLTVLVAWLVGLHVARASSKK